MPTYRVLIGEQVKELPPVKPGEPTPEVRSVSWSGAATDAEAAKDAAYEAWDRKYGPGQRPVDPFVEVAPVP